MARSPLSVPVARGDVELALLAAMANRHGLVAGATGTGKTVTLRVVAEGFSRLGVPVFMADVKGDLSGLALPGDPDPRLEERARALGLAGVERAAELRAHYGNVSAASVGAIQRALLALEAQGGDRIFGEPALDLDDLMQTVDGRGTVNVLAADELVKRPRLYATLLLWMLGELFERLPEVGDPEKPRLVFFFDEAHLLFDDAPRALLDRVEQVVRLVRSKGVGVYFVTQNPLDVPDVVLGQLGNRVQHALRAFTPRDQKAVRAAAETFRQNPT